MGGALGLRAARCEPFGRGLSGAAREQPATVGVGPARTVGGVLWGPRGTRTANGRGVRPPGSGTRLEPSSADRPHLGWLSVVVAVWLPMPRRAPSVGGGVEAYFNPTLSVSTAKALIQSNNNLIRNAGGIQGAKMGLSFGVVN